MSDRLNINDAYSILGLKPGASPTEVKRAYRKLVKIWHPDRFSHPQKKQEAEQKIKQINEAYNKLKSDLPSSAHQPSQTKETKIYANRSNAELFYNSGTENAKLGRYQEALTDFTHAIRLNPDYIEAYKYRGFICSLLGYEYRATADLNKAAQMEGKLKNKQAHSASPSSRHSTRTRGRSKLKILLERFLRWVKSFFGFNRRWR
ncbi:heat shock protein DnaJ domain-containing protein [Kalymmatonema gypsitolerans NIES-4073]|nr:heat shock protein DnaJ domain-containing protein [Scytonema sp. NIES-4073]